MQSDEPVLSAVGVTRRYGYRTILHDVTLDVRAGDVVAIVGPNGAGKTTLLRLFAGLITATDGVVRRPAVIDAVMHRTMLYHALTARENLEFSARLRGGDAWTRIGEVLSRMHLEEFQHHRVGAFSRGMQQRLAIARALLSDPTVLLLDEPTSNLDDSGCEAVLDAINERAKVGRAVVIASHAYERLARVTTAVAFLVRGALRRGSESDGTDATTVRATLRQLIDHA